MAVGVGLGACGKSRELADACVAKEVTLAVTGPDNYTCHQAFRATFSVTNGSCGPITIQSVSLVGNVTSGTCAATGVNTYTPTVTTVDAGQTATVFDLTGGDFCCMTTNCPTPFMCDETYTYTVDTSAGSLIQMASDHLDLGGCDVICPPPG